jgi:succinate dehydrogenase/fumarate reductase flavoprotein subunit
VGVAAENLRTQTKKELRAKAVILATGGVQSSLPLVREFWPKDLPSPARLLLGGGRYATGSGHEAAKQIGAVWYNMDHHWNYALGLPDPRDPTDLRGLASFNPDSIWVNVHGKRFVNEFAGAKHSLPALLAQEGATYWSIFDEAGKSSFKVTLAGWEDFRRIESVIFSNPELVKTAANVTELSVKVGLPASSLSETVSSYNRMIEEGTDKDFGRFSPKTSPKPKKIERPPFYAVQFFPITRKSMGGVKVDLSCRVLDRQQQPIPGLYAVGEVTGFGGINGKAALEGTFLGPGVVMGRIAARSALGSLGNQKPQLSASSKKIPPVPVQLGGVARQEVCANCHNISEAIAASRNGYWHFEMSHRMALERKMDCLSCHGELFPYRPETHRINRLAQSKICASCHGGPLGKQEKRRRSALRYE